MLPQPVPDEYSESPPLFRKHIGKESISSPPPPSPKRISLDDRINQVLGLEKPELVKQPLLNPYSNSTQNYQFSSPLFNQPPPLAQQQYGQYNQQYGQFNEQKNVIPSFPPAMFLQPPPPIVKPVPASMSPITPPTPILPTIMPPTPSKVVQIGNILQVVPNDEIMPAIVESTVSTYLNKKPSRHYHCLCSSNKKKQCLLCIMIICSKVFYSIYRILLHHSEHFLKNIFVFAFFDHRVINFWNVFFSYSLLPIKKYFKLEICCKLCQLHFHQQITRLLSWLSHLPHHQYRNHYRLQ